MHTIDTPAPEPVCVEAERALLGACLLAPSQARQLLTGLTGDDFAEGRNLAVHGAITAAVNDGDEPDPVTVLARLRRTNHTAGGRVFGDDPAVLLADLMQACPAVAMAPHYRRLVGEYAERRALIASAARLDRAARTAEPDTLRAVTTDTITTLTAYANDRTEPPAEGRAEQWDRRAAA